MIISVSLLFAWQCIVVYWQLPDYILPSPWQIAIAINHHKALLLTHTIPTAIEIVLGLISGVLLGCASGLMIAYSRPLARWCLPVLIISQVIPIFAIAPLIVMWLGFGIASKIFTAMLMIFFPIASAFYDGLISTQQGWLDLAQTMGAPTWRQFWTIRIPAALPSLASGLRIASVTAPLGAIVGEWVGSSQGLGYLMITANARMQIDLMFSSLIMLILISLLMYFSIDKALRKYIWW